ncbi:MAG: hypothetical protein A3J66_01510 [Candidatus Magasanikbacteria bacterium RIFCSPHIGHO2_02_FULL_47_14]|uniref:Uncharacterized protein n=1 Tax=Candidatus Magasanikbacteria bacterium RIFCSPHIGHO2_02_FULL_47_14 TaxID=1798680 RepID=A0A1F6MBF7_9BACT|nr:MAG: hypothetical protein A3J66_01510 [Candidatus Magasanikbacteria bacterium RIFCSPHIGHO2_02_FULL_47_14]
MKYFLSFLFVGFFLPWPIHAVPAPREARTYYFSQVQELTPTKNRVTVYHKQACFKGDESCNLNNEYLEWVETGEKRLDLGSGYTKQKFTSLPQYAAIPVLLFEYNPQLWELVEQENEAQVLIYKNNPEKSVSLIGSEPYSALRPGPRLLVADETRMLVSRDVQKFGDLIYVFGDKQLDEPYKELERRGTPGDYIYSAVPHQFILRAPLLNESDKKEFFDILDTVRYGKQYMGELAYDTFVHVSDPLLFLHQDELSKWARYAHMSGYEQQQAVESLPCEERYPNVQPWPEYIHVRDTNDCISGIDPQTQQPYQTCTDAAALQNPDIEIARLSDGTTPEIFRNQHCEVAAEKMAVELYDRHIVTSTVAHTMPLVEQFIKQVSSCVGSQIQPKDILVGDLQIFSGYENVYSSTSGTPKGSFNAEDLSQEKIALPGESSEYLSRTLYSLMRLYAFQVKDSEKYLIAPQNCLKFAHQNNWVYMGYAGEYAVVAEYIPDSNTELNRYLTASFFNRLRDIRFYKTGYRPLEQFRLWMQDPNKDPELRSLQNQDTTWFAAVTKKPVVEVPYAPYSFETLDIEPADPQKTWEQHIWPGYDMVIPPAVVELVSAQFDDPVDYDVGFFVGQNESCEQSNSVCVDTGSPWDYVDGESAQGFKPWRIRLYYLIGGVVLVIGLGIFVRSRMKNKVSMYDP